MRESGEERATLDLRVAHLLRISSYAELAIVSMWMGSPRAPITIGMVQASVRDEGPGGAEEDLLVRLRLLVAEAREYFDGDFPAAMARMRVSQDLVDLRIVALAGE